MTGVVVDTSGSPLPGVEITIASDTNAKALTNARGEFVIEGLRDGPHVVSAHLNGFRRRRINLSLPQQRDQRLEFVMRLGLLQHVDYVWREPRESIRLATAIARVRLDGFATETARCDDIDTFRALHNATVIEVWKGTLPKQIQIWEEGIGSCVDEDGSIVSSPSVSSAHLIGSEYVILLYGKPPRLAGLGDSSDAFLVNGSNVETHGFMDLPETVDLKQFRERLRRPR